MQPPRGSIVPLPTPFTGEEARIDEAALRRIVEFQLENGSHGLSCCGTTGEPSSLSVAERKQVVELVKDAIDGRVPFIPGTGSNNLAETLEMTRHAVQLGVGGVMIIAPYYIRPNQQNLFASLSPVARSVPAPRVTLA